MIQPMKSFFLFLNLNSYFESQPAGGGTAVEVWEMKISRQVQTGQFAYFEWGEEKVVSVTPVMVVRG